MLKSKAIQWALCACGVVLCAANFVQAQSTLFNIPSTDVVALYLHRGAFEPVLADEDQEQDPDRWCSHSPTGQEAWQIISQWVWNLRLELGHVLEPTPMRTTEFAPACPHAQEQTGTPPPPAQGYGSPEVALPWKQERFSGRDFALQPDGTLRCPAGQTLRANERRKEGKGSLRVVYAASIRSCRPCPLREQCQWNGKATSKPRQVSVLLHPLVDVRLERLALAVGVVEQRGAAQRRMAELRVRRREQRSFRDFATAERRAERARILAKHCGEPEPVQRGVSGRAQ